MLTNGANDMPEDALLEEMDTPMDMEPVCVTLDVLASSCEPSCEVL